MSRKMSNSPLEITRWLLGFAKPYWWLILLLFLNMAVFSGVMQGRVILAKYLMEDVLEPALLARKAGEVEKIPAAWRSLKLISLAAAVMAVFIGATGYARRMLTECVTWRMAIDLRCYILKHLLGLSLGFFDNRRSGDLISRVSGDCKAALVAVELLLGELLLQPLLLLAAMGTAIYLSWQLSLVAFISVPLFAIPIVKFGKKIRSYSKERRVLNADMLDTMVQIFAGVRTVKTFNMEERHFGEFAKVNKNLYRKVMQVAKYKALSKNLTTFLSNFSVPIVVLIGGYAILYDLFGIGLEASTLIPFLGALAIMHSPIRNMADAYAKFQASLAGADRLAEVLKIQSDITDAPDAVELTELRGQIAFKEVTFSYEQDPVLRDANFVVEPGEIVALVGPSGAGKSTLMSLALRLYDPGQGCIEIDGVDLRKIKQSSLIARVGIVAQDPFLFTTSLAENIGYGRTGASYDDIVRAAKAANIHDFIMTLPQQYDTEVGERGVKLSGGQRQRITIARAVLKDPPVLLLDEATSALDTESERLVQGALDNLMEHRTTLVIAHRLSTVQHADKIVVLEEGRVVQIGAHAQLVSQEGLYRKLYEMQFRANAEATPHTDGPPEADEI